MIDAPICVSCKRKMVCKKDRYAVKDPPVGRIESTVWVGELFVCDECGAEVVLNFGRPLLPEHALAYGDGALEFTY